MHISVRILTVAAGVLAVCAGVVQSETSVAAYPSRPIRLVVPFAPGGTNDVISRIVTDKLSERLGQPFVIDNRGGANGVVGTEIVARAVPDGHTLLIVTVGHAVHPSLRTKLPYDTERDFVPVGLVVGAPYVLVVPASVPTENLKELIAWVKSRPGQVNYASTGTGGAPHLAAELFKIAAGIQMEHIPYKGGVPALTDLIAGRVSVFFGSFSTLGPHIKSGKLRGIAVTTTQRSQAMPELPTFLESGVAGYEVNGWYGLLVQSQTPRMIVNRLNQELQQALADADTRKRFAQIGMDPLPGTAADFAALIHSEIAKWAKVVRAAGIEPE